MSEAVLSLENLTAGYGGVPAIRSLDLTVQTGEVVALFGSNGAGKTTVLKTVSATTAQLMAGRIVFEGQDLAKHSPTARARLGIAHVPEGRGLFYSLTVAEHFRLGYKGEELDTEFCYSHFPVLRDLRDRRCGSLSGGEQQMVAIGRAIARRPKLLLLDELSLDG
jgi:ABC-type branched-subunit amino acid transport system ATPase component